MRMKAWPVPGRYVGMFLHDQGLHCFLGRCRSEEKSSRDHHLRQSCQFYRLRQYIGLMRHSGRASGQDTLKGEMMASYLPLQRRESDQPIRSGWVWVRKVVDQGLRDGFEALEARDGCWREQEYGQSKSVEESKRVGERRVRIREGDKGIKW